MKSKSIHRVEAQPREIPEPHCNNFVEKIFDAGSAYIPGAILKRAITTIEKHASEEELIAAVERRQGFTLRKTETHYEVINEANQATETLVEAQRLPVIDPILRLRHGAMRKLA